MKMQKSLYRKGLEIGIICLLILISPVLHAISIQDKNNEEISESQSEPLPDLVIRDVYYEYDFWEQDGWFNINILNKGEGDIPGGPNIENTGVYFNYLFIPFKFGFYRYEYQTGLHLPIPPGESTVFIANAFFSYGIFDALVHIGFWINSERDISESDYENNGRWGLFKIKKGLYDVECELIGDFHLWKTDSNPPPWYPDEHIVNNQFSQTTQQQITQQIPIQQTQTTRLQTVRSNFLNRLIK